MIDTNSFPEIETLFKDEKEAGYLNLVSVDFELNPLKYIYPALRLILSRSL